MRKDVRERSKWKVRLVSWMDHLAGDVSRPVRKLMLECVFGILSSGSLRLSEIGRALQEPLRLHHTQKRLSRMLSLHSEIAWHAERLQLSHLGPCVTEGMIVAVDGGDLNRDGSERSEYRCRVRDGDTGEIVGGYPLMTVVARDVRTGRTLPLLTRLVSSARSGFRSENWDLLSVMDQVARHLPGKRLWVVDRGGDRGELWEHWLSWGWDVLVRVMNLRHWCWRGGRYKAQEIARQLPLKHRGRLRRNGGEEVRFGITRVSLPASPARSLWMVVVRHGKREPMVLVTTRAVRGRRQGERMIWSYMDRWACEESYRFTKQGFQAERVQARRFATLQNLVALASLAWGFLAACEQDAAALISRAKRQKTKKRPNFLFYTLIKGWQLLFAAAREVFYSWLRVRRPKPPPQLPLFPPNPSALLP